MNPAERTRWVIEQAREAGFELCGVARPNELPELARLEEWLERGYAGEMSYLRDPRRSNPQLVLAGARSIIVCALNYNTSPPYSTEARLNPTRAGAEAPRGWISRYAWGNDYHDVLGDKLEALLAAMRESFKEAFDARVYVDTGPVVERVAAKYAGLGWLGKNTCLINERLGSWLFLGVIITTLELEPPIPAAEGPPPDLCGQCRLCLDACPTGALVEPYVLDARRCISYLTIELRGSIPEEFRPALGRMVFGCDICQDVCPWNRKAPATQLAAFLPRQITSGNEAQDSKINAGEAPQPEGASHRSLFAPEPEWLASLSEKEFREVFRGSAVKRTKWRGLVRNACVALGNASLPAEVAVRRGILGLLERLGSSADAVIAEHARWALDRLRSALARGNI
jgi:epoxyqueuosine reductase